MRLSDGTVLMHEKAPYDPKKAHDYYVSKRHLHPRQAGQSFTVTSRTGKTYKLSAQQLAEQKAYAAHRVQQINKNLADLGVLLRAKLKAAKESEAKSAKPPTLAEKAKAARDAAKYKDSHKTEIAQKAKASSGGSAKPTTSTSTKTDTVDSLKKDISKTKSNLKAAVQRQRSLATAKKNG